MNNKELAQKYLPQILFCENEPFFPVKIGYDVFTETGTSNSFGRRKGIVIDGEKIAVCIEYQIYFDYDITHMVDLEHVWVYIDAQGKLVDAECSFHGRCLNAAANIIDETTVKLYSQPGKHAFATDTAAFEKWHEAYADTTANVGKDGLATIFYNNGKYNHTAYIDKIVRESMKEYAFTPSPNYVPCDLSTAELVTWTELKDSFIGMIDAMLDKVVNSRKHIVLFMDCGDTIIDEGTQVFDDERIVTTAEVIPGGDEMVTKLHELGYTLVIVADGEAQSFKNILNQHGIYDCFYSMIYSECVKVQKPHARMFKAAMGAAELTNADLNRILMIGNNLRKDVKGANNMGMTSVHIDWSPRYFPVPTMSDEVPDYTVKMPLDFVPLVEELNEKFVATLLRG